MAKSHEDVVRDFIRQEHPATRGTFYANKYMFKSGLSGLFQKYNDGDPNYYLALRSGDRVYVFDLPETRSSLPPLMKTLRQEIAHAGMTMLHVASAPRTTNEMHTLYMQLQDGTMPSIDTLPVEPGIFYRVYCRTGGLGRK